MIAQLRGTVVAAGPGEVVLDVGGVGYRVFVAPGTRAGAVGDALTLHTSLVVRDDALDLYGFADVTVKTLFTTLLGVAGVGPKLALSALGALGADGLHRAVVTEDVGALTVVPGIGRKGAQRMILELREKLGGLADDAGVPAAAGPAANGHDARGEARQALAALGYAPAEAAAALDAVPADGPQRPEELLRAALRALGAAARA
ncbi:MAG TPA: Holliday junction branch migration protein RuvA [Egibacteraceae bacterium]|nr:Holliday junction branch migration protein RuvA [Egibacteraceae bacterium]